MLIEEAQIFNIPFTTEFGAFDNDFREGVLVEVVDRNKVRAAVGSGRAYGKNVVVVT